MEKKSRKLRAARHGIIYVGGQLMGSAAVLITLIILARLLQPTYLGLYAIVIAFYTLLGLVSTFSMGSALRKKLPEKKTATERKKLVVNGYITALVFSLVLALIAFAFSNFAANSIYHQPQLAGPLMLASALLVFWSLFNLTISILVGIGRVVEATIIDVLYSVLQLMFSVLLVILGLGVLGAIVGLGIGIIAGTVTGLLYIWKYFGLPKRKDADGETIRELVTFSTPVFVSSMVIQGAYNLGILILGIFVSAAIVGNYNIAYELGSLFVVIISSMTFVLLPTFSQANSEASKKELGSIFNRSIYFSILILAPLVAFVASTAKPLMYLLFSNAYVYAPSYLGIISLGVALGVFWNYANILILGVGDTKSVLKYQLAAAFVQIVLLAVLIPAFGVWGMLVGLFIISPVTIDFLYINLLKRKLSIKLDISKGLRVALASVVIFLLLYGVTILITTSYWSILLNIALGLLVYPPLVAIIGGLQKSDIATLREIAGDHKVVAPFAFLFDYAERFAG